MNLRFGAKLRGPRLQSLEPGLHLRDVLHLEARCRIEWSPHLAASLARCRRPAD